MISKRTTLAALAFIVATGRAQADVTISNAATQNMNCSGGVCVPTSTDAVLNATDLENLISSGNVEVKTTGSGVQANNIAIADELSLASSNNLTLDSYESVFFFTRAEVKGKGGVSILTNDGGTAGDLFFAKEGRLVFDKTSNALTINEVAFTLENSIQSLANYITKNPGGAVALASYYNASGDGTYTEPPTWAHFTGTLEGLGNTISNFKIAVDAHTFYVGLLEQNDGIVRDLRFTNANLVGGKHVLEMGVLTAYNSGIISNCSATGIVQSGEGHQDFISGVGGLVGMNQGGTIVGSFANVAVTIGTGGVGGLAGQNLGGTISLSSATGSVSCSHPQCVAGGLVGYSSGSIDQSFATGSVFANKDVEYVGGLVGSADGTTTNSYATGSVKSSYLVGGFGGAFGQSSSVSTSYSIGLVAGGKAHKGGFDGENEGATANAYWDTDTSGQSQGSGDGNESGLTGLTTEQFQSGLPSGFAPSIWAEDSKINNGLPYLINNPPK